MNDFHFSFIDIDKTKPTILALHGTGGDEHSFTEILQDILPNPNVFGVRGKVSENGANRYFARFAEGKLDYDDLALRTHELANFLKSRDELKSKQVIAIGYSNGANMAANLLLTNSFSLSGAILLRPMFLPTAIPNLDLKGRKILINAGEHDQICPADQAKKLAETFTQAGAHTTLNLLNASHNLTQADIQSIQGFFD